jgi:hypothetical protein
MKIYLRPSSKPHVYQIVATSQYYVNLKDTFTEICDWTQNNSTLQLPVELSNWKDAYLLPSSWPDLRMNLHTSNFPKLDSTCEKNPNPEILDHELTQTYKGVNMFQQKP